MSEDADAATYFAPPLPDECMDIVLHHLLWDELRGLLKAMCLSRDWRRFAREFIWRHWVFGADQYPLLQCTVERMSDQHFADLARNLARELGRDRELTELDLRQCSGLTVSGILHALDAAALTGRVRGLYVLGVRAPDVNSVALAAALRNAVVPVGLVDALWRLDYWSLDDSALRRCGRGWPPCEGLCVVLSPGTVCHVCKTLDMQHPRLRLGPPPAEPDEGLGTLGGTRRTCDVDGCTRPAEKPCRYCSAAFCRSCAGVNLFSCELLHDTFASDVVWINRCPMCAACIASFKERKLFLVQCAQNGCFNCHGPDYCIGIPPSLTDVGWHICDCCERWFCPSHTLHRCYEANDKVDEEDDHELYCDECACGSRFGNCCLMRCPRCARFYCWQHWEACMESDCVCNAVCRHCMEGQERELNLRHCSRRPEQPWCRKCAS